MHYYLDLGFMYTIRKLLTMFSWEKYDISKLSQDESKNSL